MRNGHMLNLHVRHATDVKARERVLQRWYRERLRELVPPLVTKWEELLGVRAVCWGIKRMKTKWGACNIEARRIWLNLELAKKPVPCIEYIIVHELIHLIERHHNDRFVSLMNHHLLNWQHRRRELNSAPLSHESWSY